VINNDITVRVINITTYKNPTGKKCCIQADPFTGEKEAHRTWI
jgi:hypothetical protein